MRLILVRHGDAHAGFHGVIGGERGCAGLTPLGRLQAEALRDDLAGTGRLQADVLVASRLPRAVETATIIGRGLGLEVASRECDLCEVHPGEADGLTWVEYGERYGSFDMEAEPDRVFAPGGDSWTSFHERVDRVLGRLAADHPDQTVVAVCHAGVIMASMRNLLGMAGAGRAQLRPSNTGLTTWEHDPHLDHWTLHTFNDDRHLTRVALDEAARTEPTGAGAALEPEPEHPFTLATAREASRRDDLNTWVREFLASAGSDNAELAHDLTQPPRWWLGPVEVALDDLHRLAGPPGGPVVVEVEDHEWRDDVEDLAERVDGQDWDPPPVIASFKGDHLMLEDGNHRVEALRRAGQDRAWTVIGFDTADGRDRYAAGLLAAVERSEDDPAGIRGTRVTGGRP